ncbi:MAG: transcriptional repressor LexA, partial [Chloroflexota bacterium]
MKKSADRQQKILDFIHRFLGENGYPPSIRDIQSGCRVSSTSVVDYHLRALEQRGQLRRHREVSRGIELTGAAAPSLVPVPVIGQIAAGQPIPVPSADTWDTTAGAETLAVSRDLVGGRAGVFALRVKGMSMVDALINDGDIVLLQAASAVSSGEMAAVWLKDEKEVTLKKIYPGPDSVRLQPANRDMQPIFARPENV